MNDCDIRIENIIKKCRAEIDWANHRLNGINAKSTNNDRVFFTAWLEAHEEMLGCMNKSEPIDFRAKRFG